MARRKPRVCLSLVEIAGYYTNLRPGFEALGIQADILDLTRHPFSYDVRPLDDPILRLAVAGAQGRMKSSTSPSVVRRFWQVASILAVVPLFLRSIKRYDVFVFGFRQSFFRLRELRLLRMLGKRIVFVFHGTDARPPYMDGQEMQDVEIDADLCAQIAASKKRDLRRIERHAHAVVSHVAHAHFFERPVLNIVLMGFPIPETLPSDHHQETATAVRIVHAPSNPTLKGSAAIEAAVEAVRARGVELEFVELRGVPNHRVLEEIARCDFVIDQLYSDAPMVGLATEAAALGKPAIMAGYAWDEVARTVPRGSMPPTHLCAPEEIEGAIWKLATDPEYRRELGTRAREFVQEHWAPAVIAGRYLDVIEGRAQSAWNADPNAIGYAYGCGLSSDRVGQIVRAVVEAHGVGALQLGDKPRLERLILEAAGIGEAVDSHVSDPEASVA